MSTTQSERTKQRRRLLKSAAAVPAIFALPAGASVANSSLNACIDRGIAANPTPALRLDLDKTDIWVRQSQKSGSEGEGNYLAFVDGQPVAGASCWNSVQASGGQMADSNNILIR